MVFALRIFNSLTYYCYWKNWFSPSKTRNNNSNRLKLELLGNQSYC